MSEIKVMNNHAINDIRGRGLWVGVDVDPEYATAREICERLMKKGVLTKETHETVVRLAPPLVVTKEIIDEVIEKLRLCLQ